MTFPTGSHRRWRRGLAASLSLLAALALPAAAEATKEYQIKAAFLYNFTKFVEWPAGAFAGSNAIVLGAYCDDDFHDELAAIVRGRQVHDHPIEVKQLTAPEQVTSVHVAFICADQEGQSARIQAASQGQPVLLVGESPAMGQLGAAITFVLVDDKVRFELNTGAADRARIKISAQLQKLATAVRKVP